MPETKIKKFELVEVLPQEKYISQIIKSLGEDPKREGLKKTPHRVAKSYKTLFAGYSQKIEDILTVFDSEEYDQIITSDHIEFYSMCEHHMLPFFGKAHIGYIPDGKIVGISKLARTVEIFARRLQNQERLTQQIANALQNALNPKGVIVVIEAQHLCEMARGIAKQSSVMRTSVVTGVFRDDPSAKSEFFTLIRNGDFKK